MSIENSTGLSERIMSSGSAATGSLEAEKEDRSQEHFKTDHLLPNLKRHTISSGAVTMSAQGAKFLLNLLSTMILARLLTPRDFGLVAMVTTVTGFLRVFKDAGLSIATVQRERITHAQVSNLFWINVAISVLTSLIVVAFAPVIAWFYHNPRLVSITLLLSATFILSGTTVQHQALLKRQMRFKALALIEVSSMGVGVLVGVIMALIGCGYWSLVGSSLAIEMSGLVLTWLASSWRPQLPARSSGIGPLVSFGVQRTAGDLILSVARGCDNLLIGRFYGAAAVGLYSRASILLLRPLEQFLGPINAVFMPALCRLQSQPARYRATFLRLYEMIALTGFLLTGLLLSLARPVTLVLLGPQWEQTAVIFAGFTIAALCVPLANASAWLFTSQGRGQEMLITQSINACAIVFSFFVGLPFGPVGVAMVFSVSTLLIRIPIYYYSAGRNGPVRTADLWRVFFRHLPVWVVVFSATSLTLVLASRFAPLLQLLICVPAGVLSAALLIYSSGPQRRVASHLLRTLLEFKKNR
jgi:O-antigen/teichoic acid export membrane protein